MTTRLVFLPRTPSEAAFALDLDAGGAVLGRGPLARLPPASGRVVVAVPGAQALARWIDLPARTEAQARSAAAFLLEDALATPREATHVALGAAEADGRRLAVAADKAVMRGWMAEIAALGLSPAAVTPDHLLLAPPADGRVLAARIGDMVALRGEAFAATCEPELAPLVAGERPLVWIDDPAEAEAAFARGTLFPAINLLQGDFAPRAQARSGAATLRAPAILLALVLTLPLAAEAARYVRHAAGAETARMRAEAAARAALPPEQAQARDPVAIARARAAALAKGGGGFVAPASALFAAIEATPSLRLERLQFTPDGLLRASVNYADYSELETLRARLQQAGFQVEEGGSTNAEGRVVTELTVRGAS